MDERSSVLLATLLGAVAGGMVGFLYLTRRGRTVRDQLEPTLDSFVEEIDRARGTVEKARHAVHEGRRAFDDMMAAARGSTPTGEAAGDGGTSAGTVQ